MREYGKESGECREFGGVWMVEKLRNFWWFGEWGQVWENIEEVGKCVRGWERCERVYGVSVEGVRKCVEVWGRVEKSGETYNSVGYPHAFLHLPPHFFTPPLTVLHNPYIPPPTLPHIPPYVLYHLLHAKISHFSHLLSN